MSKAKMMMMQLPLFALYHGGVQMQMAPKSSLKTQGMNANRGDRE